MRRPRSTQAHEPSITQFLSSDLLQSSEKPYRKQGIHTIGKHTQAVV